MLRIVLDTNILVSAMIHDGKPRNLFKMGIEGKYKIVMSKETLSELTEVVRRPKFKMTEEDIIHIISTLRETGEIAHITSSFEVIGNDSDDNIIINTAYDGNADYIVSGDKDVHSLKRFQKIKIVSVDEMLKILR